MITIVISVHPNCSENTQTIKDKVVEYLGKRMVFNPDDSCPHIVRVNEEIPFPDRKVLAEIAREIDASAILLAISHDGDNCPVADTYVSLVVGLPFHSISEIGHIIQGVKSLHVCSVDIRNHSEEK